MCGEFTVQSLDKTETCYTSIYLLFSNCVFFVLRVCSLGQALSQFKIYKQKSVAG